MTPKIGTLQFPPNLYLLQERQVAGGQKKESASGGL
jgi:hypothetical protein